MADITDIKQILFTEKAINLQEGSVITVSTSPKMTKNSLKKVFQEYFGFTPLRVNSLNMAGKTKRFKGMTGTQDNFKKFYVKLPDGAKLESLAG